MTKVQRAIQDVDDMIRHYLSLLSKYDADRDRAAIKKAKDRIDSLLDKRLALSKLRKPSPPSTDLR